MILPLFSKKESEKGQAFLIVVLVMVIALTVGLSLASRTVFNLKSSSEDVNSQKAFSAAEAGIEQALQNGTNINKDFGSINGAKISQLSVVQIGQNLTSFTLNNGYPIPQDDGVDVWLTDYSTDATQLYTGTPWTGTLKVYWGTSSDVCNSDPTKNTQAAMEIIVITGTKSSPTLTRYALDPCAARRTYNSLSNTQAGGTVGGISYQYSYSISITSGLAARVIPLYASTPATITGSIKFPAQGQFISATGTAGTTQRKVNYYQAYESLPSEYFYALFSPK